MSGVDEQANQKSPPQASQDGAEEQPLFQVALQNVVRPLAIAGMLTCVAVSMAQLIASFGSAWPGGIFAALIFGVSLESIQASKLIKQKKLSGQDRFRFRFVEWVMLLLIARFVFYLNYGAARLAQDFALWASDINYFFDIQFIVVSALMLLFWAGAMVLAETMLALDASPFEHMPSITDPNHYLRATMPHQGRVNRREKLDRIASIFFAGGMLILILAGGARVDVRELVVLGHGRSSGVILNVLIYFVLGFLLLSQARYAVLRANWDIEAIPVLNNIGRRWVLYVGVFLLLVALISALLPVDYSVGLLDSLGAIVRWFIWLLVQIVFSVLYVVTYLISLIANLFRGDPVSAPSAPPFAPPPQAPGAETSGGWPWWHLVRSLIFWTVLLGIVGYSVFHTAINRLAFIRNLRLKRILAWLQNFWRRATGASQRTVQGIRKLVQDRLAARRERLAKSKWRYVAVGRLAPRDQVRYFYLSLLKRARDAGHGRPAWSTPAEYEASLSAWLAENEGDLHELTAAFNEARYSAHDVSGEKASALKTLWRQVRRTLNSARRRVEDEQTKPEPPAQGS